MSDWVLDFQEIGAEHLPHVGGKGVNLGLLSKMEGIRVPEGFCVTTAGYRQAVERDEAFRALLARLAEPGAGDHDRIAEISRDIRQHILDADIAPDVAEAVARSLSRFGEEHAYAVRSSATAEDLPHASFAGQQDTYLNIIGLDDILRHIRKCWASLFTDRAVIYRMMNGFDHSQVSISVIVQRMVFPQASGVMFTADPITSNRKLLSIDASFGLGEALVSGMVTPDGYKVREGHIVEKTIAAKTSAVYGRKEGGTESVRIDPDRQHIQALSDPQILELARIGRTIEAGFGRPQDIEWCLADDVFYIVQSRPITSLFPIPEADDRENRVYVSVGHQQMMTDPIKPLGLSFFLMTTPAPMRTAGGRLFVDVTRMLSSPESRHKVIDGLGKSDPLIKDALLTVIERGDFIPTPPAQPVAEGPVKNYSEMSPAEFEAFMENHRKSVAESIGNNRKSLEELRHAIGSKSGAELFDWIREDIPQLRKFLFDPQMGVIMEAMEASAWINDKMYEWLGEKQAADVLSQSVPNNITSEMGLALMDVADVIRPYPEVIEYLRHQAEDGFPDDLVKLAGGREARDAVLSYLDKYGMRCAGEIDLTRTRWSEKPAALIPMILNNIQNFEPGAGRRKFEQGRRVALEKEKELLDRLSGLPDGERKVLETKRRIDLIRNFIGFREYPKYGMVARYFIYKQALLKEAERLVRSNVIREKEDIYYLTFDELREASISKKADNELIDGRKEEYRRFEKLTPPRVITSDGEIIAGSYRREELPEGAIAGLPVSAGVAEGRARVILRMEDARLEAGEILVTVFTDPSWTPLFVSVQGLVTEVGGLMTHGAVIAREYGLPAVVGVENATKRIKDGQRIRVHGTEGYVEILG